MVDILNSLNLLINSKYWSNNFNVMHTGYTMLQIKTIINTNICIL